MKWKSPRFWVFAVSWPRVLSLSAAMIFAGALFWARERDPFSRDWFTVKAADGSSIKCVAVLPKAVRRCPVIVYTHGSGGTLMSDGNVLRQLAELGLGVVSFQYDQTNQATFASQFEAVQGWVSLQSWSKTNTVAWVGVGLGANRLLDFALRHPNVQPKVLVLLNGGGMRQAAKRRADLRDFGSAAPTGAGGAPALRCSVLLIHGEQDQIQPISEVQRLAAGLRRDGVSVELKTVPGVLHDLSRGRKAVFRGIGEYCLSHLAGRNAWAHYHSIAEWKAEAPAFWVFCLPAIALGIGGFWLLRYRRKRLCLALESSGPDLQSGHVRAGSEIGARRPGASRTRRRLKWHEVALRCLAGLLALRALSETAVHLVTPYFAVSSTTLSIARRYLVPPKEREDFEFLAGQLFWRHRELKVLLTDVELADYNRQLINWKVDEKHFREDVLSPVITGASGERFNWRRPLWEEFYPRIRHENSPEDAARIVVRHLRARVTILNAPNLPHDIPAIWLKQITDKAGFEIIYVAALRSVGVPARLNQHGRAELFADGHWRLAPSPSFISLGP